MVEISKQLMAEIEKCPYIDETLQDALTKDELTAHGAAALFCTFGNLLTDGDLKLVLNAIDKASIADLGDATHRMCHVYENGKMAEPEWRAAGDAILNKLIEKAEQGLYAHTNRSIDGYWKSVKEKPDAWNGFRDVLTKHSDYAFAQKYLGYMDGQKPEDEEILKKSYLEDPNMLFVTTTMVDIDGTLLKNGKLDTHLIEALSRFDYTIFTGGNPEKQKDILMKAAASEMLEQVPALKEKYTVNDIISAYVSGDKEMRNDISRITRKDDKASICRTFIRKLTDNIDILPKQAFTQDNVCLSGRVIDDTQPEVQGIKSLNSSVSHPHEDMSVYLSLSGNVPENQKITAKQFFEIYQQKEQLTSTITNKLKELKDKTKSENIGDIPHLKTQIFRAISEEQYGKPKRPDADKKVIKAAMDKAIQNTKN